MTDGPVQDSDGMWISSFLVTLPLDRLAADRIRTALQALPVFEIGPPIGRQLPVVLEATDGNASRYWHQWVEALSGVKSKTARISQCDTLALY